MTTIREFRCIDLLRFASVNLDHFVHTETMSFYLRYLGQWASYIKVAVAPCNRFVGYIIGEAHSGTRDTKEGTHWSAHVTAVAVASENRRSLQAKKLMHVFEENHDKSHKAYYTNLFVRESNIVAIAMFIRLGYLNVRCKPGFYSNNEDALEFRKFYSEESDTDDYGNERPGMYKAVDDLNYCADPLFIWGDGRKAKGIGRQR